MTTIFRLEYFKLEHIQLAISIQIDYTKGSILLMDIIEQLKVFASDYPRKFIFLMFSSTCLICRLRRGQEGPIFRRTISPENGRGRSSRYTAPPSTPDGGHTCGLLSPHAHRDKLLSRFRAPPSKKKPGYAWFLLLGTGVEPARHCWQGILSPF